MNMQPFLRALRDLLPEAEFDIIASRKWMSMTFSGQQLTVACGLSGPQAGVRLSEFGKCLPTQEFELPGQLVADIRVTGCDASISTDSLTIEALILTD